MLIFLIGPSGATYQFQVSERYVENQVVTLTTGEARVLNLSRAENVARNKSRLVKRTEEMSDQNLLTLEQIEFIQSEIDRYDQSYEFANIPIETDRSGDIEREALNVSTLEGGDPTSKSLREEARKRVIAKRGLAEKAIAELIDV